ncbi:MAG: glutaredoxin domain-containing protein [Myxococcota bacterium]
MRKTLEEERIDPDIRSIVDQHHRDVVEEVDAATRAHDVLVVGMAQNPFPKRARKALEAAGIAFHYVEYGSYLNTWRPRTALKMFTGWPTFPMVFVKGVLVGGAAELIRLIDSGELRQRLASSAHPKR